jgi:hypothetical protein
LVVVERDLEAGIALEHDFLAARQVPEMFVTKSAIRPDQVELVLGQKIAIPMSRGDLLLWGHFYQAEAKAAPVSGTTAGGP